MRRNSPQFILGALVVLGLLALIANRPASQRAVPRVTVSQVQSPTEPAQTLSPSGFQQAAQAFAEHRSGVMVTASGVVTRILQDDLNAPRHQKFIVTLGNGQTLLIAHNIDIAPRIHTLRANASVVLCGEYVWNDQGGLVHWTHHDPPGRHPNGWIQYNGQFYW